MVIQPEIQPLGQQELVLALARSFEICILPMEENVVTVRPKHPMPRDLCLGTLIQDEETHLQRETTEHEAVLE